jgi:pimeloyl-ACP methyl ester carboxylesterase
LIVDYKLVNLNNNSLMMKKYIFLLLLITPFFTEAQPFAVGHKTLVYNDPSRTGGFGSGGGPGRQIQCEVYYPANAAGNDTPFAPTVSPLIVLGHGFVMGYDAYQNIWEYLVPMGYIVVLPRTEGSFSPVHSDFAKDLIVVQSRFAQDAANSANVYYGIWNGKSAVMGHSMGGGATFLAAGDPTSHFDAAIGLAPAETSPSAVTAAATCAIPSLILSGSQDVVTPPSTNHELIYQAIPNTVCKQFVSVLGGGHCYFANANTACDFGETTSGGNMTISRTEQHDIMNAVISHFLGFYLKGICSEWTSFQTELNTDTRISSTSTCSYQPMNPIVISQSGSWLIASSATNYQWYINGILLVGETNDSISVLNNGLGDYQVSSSDFQCTEWSNMLSITIVQTPENQATYFIHYPNPTAGLMTLKTISEQPIEIRLSSSQGTEIGTFQLEKELIIDFSSYSSGVYFITSSSGQITRVVRN